MAVRTGVLKGVVGLLAVCLAGYILGPPLYWHLREVLASTSVSSASCPVCECDCDSLSNLSIPQELVNASLADCAKNDPEMNPEMQKYSADLLSEQVRIHEAEAQANQQRADVALLEAKKMTSQYQKEADKCNSGMETCEEAREKSEAALIAQRQLTVLWEQRARQRGWRDERVQSKSST